MADQFVQVPADSTGKKIDTSELTVGANTVERQRIVVGDPTTATSLAAVKAASTAAVAGDPALVVAVSPNNTIPVSAASLPLPAGASTAAKQPALGTAGTASADVLTVQGIASMTALKVDGSGVTQPVSAASLPLPTGAALDATLTGKAAQFRVTDGTNTSAVKAASTVAAAADPALVVTLSPNVPAHGTPLFVRNTDGTNDATVKAASTVAAAADTALVVTLSPNVPLHGTPLFVRGTDGTNNTPAMDAAARAGFVQVTDGTNIMPTMDALARAGYVRMSDGTTVATVDPTAKALRTRIAPPEVVGAYGIRLVSGAVTGVAANAPIWSFRYTGSGLLVVLRVELASMVTTAFTAAQLVDYELLVARSFSASDTTGTAAILTGNNGKMRTIQATTALGDCRIGTTGALTAGTRTLDSQGIGYVNFWANAAGAGFYGNAPPFLYTPGPQEYPVILANNEGLVINNITAMGAAGVLKLAVIVRYLELASGAL